MGEQVECDRAQREHQMPTVRFRDGNEAVLVGERWRCSDRVLERMLNSVRQSWICDGRAGYHEMSAVQTIARLFHGEIVEESDSSAA
jgi:hypothetical protein